MADIGDVLKRLDRMDEKLDGIQEDVTEIKVCNGQQGTRITHNTEAIGKLEGRQWQFFVGNGLLAAIAAVLGLK